MDLIAKVVEFEVQHKCNIKQKSKSQGNASLEDKVTIKKAKKNRHFEVMTTMIVVVYHKVTTCFFF